MAGHLKAIGYFHRVRTGKHPIADIPRVMLMVRGLRRANGPTQRNLPATVEDLGTLKGLLDLGQVGQQILWTSVLLGWVFMLRMGEFLDAKNPLTPDGRRPVLISDIDPLCDGKSTRWGKHVDEVMVHISGSQTDWLNQGCVWSHIRLATGSANQDICAARAIADLFTMFPAKFSKNRDAPLATWRNGGAIRPGHVTAKLRSAVTKNGENPSAYSIHSLRAGGATALYRETKEIALAARFGRWKTGSISAYL